MNNLKSVIEIKNGKIANKNGSKYPIFGGNGIIGFSDEYNYENIIIIGRVGANCGSVHKYEGKCWVSDNALAGLPLNKSNSFNYYLIKSINLNSLQIGSSQPLLTQTILYNINVAFCQDELTQQKIASVLSALDDKIELNNKINAELEAMAKTLYDYWFVQFEFPVVTSSGVEKPYKSSGGKMIFNETLKREIPEGWEVKKLEEVGNITAGGDKPINISHIKNGKYCIPIFSNGITNEGFYGFTDAAKVFKPSITISARGTIGFTVLRTEPYVPVIRLLSFTPKIDNCELFFFYEIQRLQFENSGSVQQQLTVPQVSNLEILYPYNSIMKLYFEKTRAIVQKIDSNKKQNQELSSLRNWLLPMLMNGQVTVNDAEDLRMVAEETSGYKK